MANEQTGNKTAEHVRTARELAQQAKGREGIEQHEGKKYLRTIRDAIDPKKFVRADIYDIINACKRECPALQCPAVQHALKKLLAAGVRGKGTVLDDLKGAMSALNRAIDFAEQEAEASKYPADGLGE